MKCFLSHSSKDKTWFVRQVYDRLPQENTVIDEENFRAAAYTRSEIEQNIQICSTFVYFISEKSLESGWVQDEIRLAEDLCKEGKIKLFIPVLLDDISYADNRFSSWLKDNFVLKYLGGPKSVAKRIKDEMTFLQLNLNPILKEEYSLCLGRFSEAGQFVNRCEDFQKEPLLAAIVSGIPKIGRKTFLRNILNSSQLKLSSYRPYEIPMDERGSIEDFIVKLDHISDSLSIDDMEDMLNKSMEHKIELALKIIADLASRDEVILIDDESCIVDYMGNLPSWFSRIIKSPSFPQKLVFLIATKRSLFNYYPQIFNITLKELKHPDTISVFSRLLSIRGKVLPAEDKKFWTDLMVGHPGQIKHALTILEQNNYIEDAAKKESYQLVGYINDQAATLLQRYIADSINATVLRFFALAEFSSVELFSMVFNDECYVDALKLLLNINALEYIGANNDFIRLNGVLRDYVLRNTNKFKQEFDDKIIRLTQDFISNNERTNFQEDISQCLFFATVALESSTPIESRMLFPVHIIKAMINIYNKGDNYPRVIELADSLLAYQNNIAENVVKDATYYKCLSLARLQNSEVLSVARQLPHDLSTFVKGFYYRRIGRASEAIDQFQKIAEKRYIGHRAKREMVLAMQQLEEYDEALWLARDNYRNFKQNFYHIQALFKCLVLGSTEITESVAIELRDLITELEKFPNGQAIEMAKLAKAQYEAFVNHNFTKAYDLTSDTIALFPDSKYPILTQMDIALAQRNYNIANQTNNIIDLYLRNHKQVAIRTFARSRAYFLSGIGHRDKAISLLQNELERLPEAAKEKLLAKVNNFDQNRLR